jgi:hypothetical protein
MRRAGLASARRRPVNSALGRGMHPSSLTEHRQLSEVDALRGRTAGPRSVEYQGSEVQATPSNGVHKGASRRRAAPGGQPSHFRHMPSARRMSDHRDESKAQCQAAASLQASALPSQLLLVYKQGMSVTNHEPRPNLSLNRSANGVSPGPRGSCGSSSASRPRRHTAVARLTLR